MGDATVDYVVIGAGSAGCVLANRLSDDPSTTVLLLEAGPRDLSPYIHIPAGLVLLQQRFDWRYEAQPDASRNGAIDKWSGGKVLGGSSSINGMLWVRGNAADFDAWRENGCPGWGYDDVLPYFIRAETYDRPGGPFRGVAGPQHVSHVRTGHPLTEAFLQAAVQVGHRFNPDYNGETQAGVANAQVSQRGGFRDSTARAYLLPVRRRRNLEVKTGALVHNVIIEAKRAVGVRFVVNGELRQVRATSEVIIAAGALASPKLLWLSGVGPADALRRLDLPVNADSPGVGRNLQEHPYAMMSWHVDMPTLNVEVTPRAFLRHGLDYVLRRRGPGSSPVTHAVLFAGEDESGGPAVQGSFSPMAFGAPAAGTPARSRGGDAAVHDVHAMKLHKRPAVNVLPCVLHPEGRGTVTLRTNRPHDPIRIEHELIGRARDIERLIEAVKSMRAIMAAPAMAAHVLDERLPGVAVQSDAELREWLHAASWRGEHPVGTCRMGSDDESVVDPELRVRGIEGLRVADASVFPTLTSGNTNAPVVMVSEKASDLVLGRTIGSATR